MATNLRNTIFSTLPEHTLSQETYTPKYGFILIAEGTLQIDFVTATHAAIYTVLPISLVLSTGTGTYVVLKYIFQVLVLVLVLAYKVLVLVLVLESLVLVLVYTGTCNKVLVARRKFSCVVETLQV